MTAIEQLRRDILREYVTSIGLPANANYISGAPLRPVVPLDTGSDVFIIGAYPSSRFGVMNGERNVPMADRQDDKPPPYCSCCSTERTSRA